MDETMKSIIQFMGKDESLKCEKYFGIFSTW